MTDSSLDPRPAADARTNEHAAKTDVPDAVAPRRNRRRSSSAERRGRDVDERHSADLHQTTSVAGIVIFVHGVNSEGEWFEAAEQGLCDGLNRRLGRLDDQLKYRGIDAGQLMPAKYTESVTPDGFESEALVRQLHQI